MRQHIDEALARMTYFPEDAASSMAPDWHVHLRYTGSKRVAPSYVATLLPDAVKVIADL